MLHTLTPATAVPVTHSEDLPPPLIADAALAEALLEPVGPSHLDAAIAQLNLIEPDFQRLAKAHTAAEDAAIALRGGSDAEQAIAAAAVETAEAAWVAVQDHRIDLALAVLQVPATEPSDILRKLDAYARAFDVEEPSALYDRGDMAAAIDAVAVDLRAMRDADAHLLALEAEFLRLFDLELITDTDGSSDEVRLAASNRTGDICAAIMATPASTLPGLRAKARAVAWCFNLKDATNFRDDGDDTSTSARFCDRLFSDLLASPAPAPATPPCTLSAMEAAYTEWDENGDETSPMELFADAPCLDAATAIEKLRFIKVGLTEGESIYDEQVLDQVIAFLGADAG